MNLINTNKIIDLHFSTSEAVNDSAHFLNVKSINSTEELTEQYSNIYDQCKMKNKWVLMVNPEQHSLENMNVTSTTSTPRILQVHSNNMHIKVKNIETALRKGHCSAVVLCNVHFNEKELAQLYTSAKQGNTQCIILNNKTTVH